ncbi:MAG: amidohydrolase [Candidatus Schekmanbacteria bacterium]|nr:amidohydrolase [Candidatus Schekmanbacteria bacterium]
MNLPAVVDPRLLAHLIAIRRDLHEHPELSWHERRTSERVRAELQELGIVCRAAGDQPGVIAELPGTQELPYIALRADLDALPVCEQTDLPFRSANEGVMHACGHDGHTAMLLGAAAILSRRGPLRAPVRLIFQPAEEDSGGADSMIALGALRDVAYIFGGHVDRFHEPGTIVVAAGTVNASSDEFRIVVRGRGGHAARPHEGIDAIVAASSVVVSAQSLVARGVDPGQTAVVSIGQFAAGTAPNVIADTATLAGTVRTRDAGVRAQVKEALVRLVTGICRAHGAESEVTFVSGTPPLVNHPDGVALARAAAADATGAAALQQMAAVNMGAEDFACYLDHVPGCYVRFGAQVSGRPSFPAHSARFDFDERALAIGAAFFYHAAARASDLLTTRLPLAAERTFGLSKEAD